MGLSNLFTPEAIAAYLVFLLGIIVAIIGFFIRRVINRAKPMKVRLIKTSEASLVKINDELKKIFQFLISKSPLIPFILLLFKSATTARKKLKMLK